MTLFAPDLYRSFAIGFVGAGALLAATTIDDVGRLSPDLVPEAQAATKALPTPDDIQIADEFLILDDSPEATQ